MSKVPLENLRIRKDLIARCLIAEQQFRGGETFAIDASDAEALFRDFAHRLDLSFSGFKYGFLRKAFWTDRKRMELETFEEFIHKNNLSTDGPSASEYVRKILIPSMPIGFSKTSLSDGHYEYVTFSNNNGYVFLAYCPVPKRMTDSLIIAGDEMQYFLDKQKKAKG